MHTRGEPPTRRRHAPPAGLPLLLGVVVAVLLAARPAQLALASAPWERLVDLDVYRAAGRSVLEGRDVYAHRTDIPHLLPFTYPPVAALAAAPLAVVPLTLLQWLWTVGQVVLLAWVVAVAFSPLLERAGAWRPLAVGALTGGACWLVPVEDGLFFGQVDVLLVALCLADLTGRVARLPRGVLVGVATAGKLTPGVFAVHLWLSGQRRAAVTAALTVLALTALAAVVLPSTSVDYWTSALLDSERLGSNDGTSNQSLRGAVLRLGPEGTPGTLLWLALCVPTAALGFTVARRAALAGDHVMATAAVGLLAVLLSPVAWIHHLTWVVVVVAALVGDGRSAWRWLGAAGTALFYSLPVPWWGVADMWGGAPMWWARLQQQSYLLGGLVLLVALAALVRPGQGSRSGR